jgi:purine-binding chemotaxis protein CheW
MNATESIGQAREGHEATASLAGKYLTFSLGAEEYGVPVLKIREIIKMMDITQVPQAPPHVKGVVNLRGKVIPVVELRLSFGLPSEPYTDRTCIVVVEIAMMASRVLMGIVVDSVSEVLTVNGPEIEPTPRMGDRIDTDYVSGLAKVKGTVKILLDLDRVLGADPIAGRFAA